MLDSPARAESWPQSPRLPPTATTERWDCMRIPCKMTLKTVDFRVKGKVQGVFFRVFARDTAQQLGVVGWVKNDPVRALHLLLLHITYRVRHDAGRRCDRNCARRRRGIGQVVCVNDGHLSHFRADDLEFIARKRCGRALHMRT